MFGKKRQTERMVQKALASITAPLTINCAGKQVFCEA